MSVTWWFLVGAGGTRHRLPRELIFAGREDCELVLHSRSVDKQHAVINYDLVHDEHMLKDLGSLNGTFVNEVRVPEQTYVSLKQSDVIRFGYDSNVYTVEKGEHKVPEEALKHEAYSSTMQRLQEERGAPASAAATSEQATQDDDGQAAAEAGAPAPDPDTAVDIGKGAHEAPPAASRGTPLYGRPSWWGESDGEWKGHGATDSAPHGPKPSGTDGAAMQLYPSPPDGASEEEAQKSSAGPGYMEGANGYAGLRREPSYFEIPTKELQREGSEPPTRDTDCSVNTTEPVSPLISGPGHASFTIEFDENSPGKVTIRDHVPGATAGSGGGGGGGGGGAGGGSACSGSPGLGQAGGRPRLSGRDSPRIAADGGAGADSKVADWLAQSGSPAACARRSARKAGGDPAGSKGEATANGKAFKGSKHEDGTQSDREDESVRGSGGKGGCLRDALAKHRLEQQQVRLRSRDEGAASPGPAPQATPPAQRQAASGHGTAAAFTIEFFFNEDDGNPRKRRSNSFSPGSAPETADGSPLSALRGKPGRGERSASPQEPERRGKPAPAYAGRRSREGSPHAGEARLLSEKTFVSVSVGPRPELPRTSPDGDVQKNGDGSGAGDGAGRCGARAETREPSKVFGVSVNVSSSLSHTDKDGKTTADGITAASAALGWKDGKPDLEWQSGLGGTIAVYPVTQITGTDPLAQARPVGPVAPSSSQYRSQWASLATTPNGSWPSFPPGQDRPVEPTPASHDKADADGGESCVSVRSSASDGISSQSDRRRRALPQIPLERTHSEGIPTTAVGPFLARPSAGTSAGTGTVEENDGGRVAAADSAVSQGGQTVADKPPGGSGNIWDIDVKCISVKESASSGLRSSSAKATAGMQRSDAGDVIGGARQPSQSDSGFSTPKKSPAGASDEQRDGAGSRQQSNARPESDGGLLTRPLGDKPLRAIGLLNSSLQDEVLGRPRSASESRPTRPGDEQKRGGGKALVRQGSFTKERPSSLVPIEMLPHISTVAPAESLRKGTEARPSAPSSEAPKVRSNSREESGAKAVDAAVGKDFSTGHGERSNGGETRRRNDSGSTVSSIDTSLLLKETEAAVAALEAKLSVPGGWEGPGSPVRSPSPESDVDTSSTVSLVNGEGQRKAVTQRKVSANAREKLSELRKARSLDPGAKADAAAAGSRRCRPGADRLGTFGRPPSADWTTDDDRPPSSSAARSAGRSASSDRAACSRPPPGLTSTDELLRTKLDGGGGSASAAAMTSRGGGVTSGPPRGGFLPTPPSSKPRPTRTSLMRRARLGDASDNESGDVDRASVISDVSTTSSTGARPSPQPGPRRTLSRIDLLAQPRRPRVSSSRSDTEATVVSPASGRSSLGGRIAEAGRGSLAARLSGGAPGAMARSRTCSESRDREPRSRSSSSTHSSPSGTRWRHRLTDYTSTSEDEFGGGRGGPAAPRYAIRMRPPGAPADARAGAARSGPPPAGAPPHHHHHHHRPPSGSSSSASTLTSSRPHPGSVGAALPPRGAGSAGGAPAVGSRKAGGTVGGAAHAAAGRAQAKSGDEDYLRHWTVHSEEIARISKDLAKDLAILAREIHSVTGDPDGVSSSGTAPSTTGSTGPPTPGSSIDAREEVVLDTLMLTSIAQLSQRIRSATDKTTSKIRYLFKDQDLPWEAIESKLSFDGEVPLLKTTSRELTSILQDLRKVEKQLQVINFIIDPDRVLESVGALIPPVTASTPARVTCGYTTQALGLVASQPSPAGSLTPMPAPHGSQIPFLGHAVACLSTTATVSQASFSLGHGAVTASSAGQQSPRLSLLSVSVDAESTDGLESEAGSHFARTSVAGGDGKSSQG